MDVGVDDVIVDDELLIVDDDVEIMDVIVK